MASPSSRAERGASQSQVTVERLRGAGRTSVPDTVAVEEPLEIRMRAVDEPMPGTAVTVTMRTPGNDEDLAVGFLHGEGMIRSMADIAEVGPCGPTGQVVGVRLAAGIADPRAALQRNFYTTSSCGVCGKSSIDSVMRLVPEAKVGDRLRIAASILQTLPAKLADRQAVFAQTGGLHAAALVSPAGELLALYEDVGRHNATDKLIGAELRAGGARLRGSALLLSGRASFELLQKAAMAGIELVAAIGAPSSLAVELAISMDQTLVGFLKRDGFNIYCGARRIDLAR